MSARENFSRRSARVAQPSRAALAQLLAFLADYDRIPRREFRRPACDRFVRSPNDAWDETRIGGEILISAYVNERGAMRNADETRKLSEEMELIDDMVRPWVFGGRDSSAVASWGDRFPMFISRPQPTVLVNVAGRGC
jgi:hypothetical protein